MKTAGDGYIQVLGSHRRTSSAQPGVSFVRGRARGYVASISQARVGLTTGHEALRPGNVLKIMAGSGEAKGNTTVVG